MISRFKATIRKGIICPLLAVAGRVSVDFARFKPDAVIDVTVETESRKRTLKQNARYWSLIVPAFSEWTGFEKFPESAEKAGIAPKDSAHAILKAKFIGDRDITLPNGEVVRVRPSTACLTTAEMADLQDKAERFLNENGIYLPAEE